MTTGLWTEKRLRVSREALYKINDYYYYYPLFSNQFKGTLHLLAEGMSLLVLLYVRRTKLENQRALRSPFCSDPDDGGCSCKGCGGPGVVVQVDHGVVGGAQAAKGSTCAHLSFPQTLQVALRRTTQGEMSQVHKSSGVNLTRTLLHLFGSLV